MSKRHLYIARVKKVLTLTFWINRLYSVFTKVKIAKCGSNFRVRPSCVVLGGKNIQIGNNFSALGQNYLYANDGELIIGNNCSLNTNVQLGASGSKITLSNNILIGPNVVIRCANHGISRKELIRLQPHTGQEIKIEEDVWIGSNAVVLPGVILAKGTVVGAGSVVTKSTEPYSIVGGIPAKKIKNRS